MSGQRLSGADILFGISPGTLVAELRRERGLSQRQLALRAGTTQAAVSRLERGLQSPGIDTLERLLLVLGYQLELGARPLALDVDERHLAAGLDASPAERLERALAWDRFGAELAGVALRSARVGEGFERRRV